jgi:protein-disulfide isomerase
VEFFDPACETCKAFHPFVKHLMSSNPGKIRLVVRYTPFHKGSDYVVKLLEAARLQNKFWETLEATYASQPAWASHGNPQPERLWSLLSSVGLDQKRARHDMQSQTIAKHIQQDMADAQQLQVTKTPGFFVNGKPLVRFGYEQLQQLVDTEIRSNY